MTMRVCLEGHSLRKEGNKKENDKLDCRTASVLAADKHFGD